VSPPHRTIAFLGLNELFVDDVTPAPDSGHLLVHVVVPAERSVTDALSSLRQDASRLRSDVDDDQSKASTGAVVRPNGAGRR
jgi:hypothetical protein